MKKNVLFISAVAAVAMALTGCSVEGNVNVSEITDMLTAGEVTVNITASEPDESGNIKISANASAAGGKNEETVSVNKENSSTQEGRVSYDKMDDIRCDGVTAWKNSNGSITLEFEDGKFALTLPSEWDGHFVFDGTSLCAKIASEKDGKIMSMQFLKGGVDNIGWFSAVRGYSADTYWITHPVTDMRYNPDIREEAEEYEMLRKNMNMIFESRNDETGKMETMVTLPDNAAKGYIYEYASEQIYGYTDSYIRGEVSEEEGRNYPVEGGWNITVKRTANVPGKGVMYDCYDAEDGDHYGWIEIGFISDYNK